MSFDLGPMLEGFDYVPGRVTARLVVGDDGREKIQMRTELGLVQLEADGPPDGKERMGYPSLLHFHRARMAPGHPPPSLRLTSEECHELFEEAGLYYMRYSCCLQLRDYRRAERDTTCNLEAMDLCRDHAIDDDDRLLFEEYRPLVLMMRARARAGRLMEDGDPCGAADQIAEAISAVRRLLASNGSAYITGEADAGIRALEELAQELRGCGADVVDRVELRLELRRAIDREDYRLAAELRDALRNVDCHRPNDSTS